MGLNALSTWNLLQLLCGLGLLVAGAELLVRCAVSMAATLKVRPLLIGLTVVNREGIELGKVDSLMESGANDLLVVKGKREHLIPFVAAFVGKVDLAGRTIEVDWGEDY